MPCGHAQNLCAVRYGSINWAKSPKKCLFLYPRHKWAGQHVEIKIRRPLSLKLVLRSKDLL